MMRRLLNEEQMNVGQVSNELTAQNREQKMKGAAIGLSSRANHFPFA